MYDDRTFYYEHKSSIEKQIGVNIDVFPVDYVPDDESEWLRFNRKRRLIVFMNSAKYVALRLKNRTLLKNVGLIVLKILLFPFSAQFMVRYVDTFIRQYNRQKTNRYFECACGIIQKRPFLKSDFDETITHVFEEYTFCIMKGYDDYLSNGFGDYMTLPPIEKRVSHHYFKAYWK